MSTWRPSACSSLARENPRRVAGFEHDGAGAVAEQHTRAPVLEIEDAREHFGTDHQRLAGGTGADHRIGDRQRVDEARAHRLHVERRAAGDAELLLHQARGRREHHVGRAGRDDDQIDAGGVDIGRFERTSRGLYREVAAADIRLGEMARSDAGAFDDPLVRSLDAIEREPCGERVIRQTLRRQEAAGAGDAGMARRGRCHAVRAMSGAVPSPCATGTGMAASDSRIRSWTRSSKPFRAAS